MAIAHTRNESGVQQDLVEHLTAVAELTRAFARGIGADEAGHWLGLWHDVGKFHPRFQSYLAACERDPDHREYVDHKAAGAMLASEHLGALMAMVLQAHHGGLKSPTEFQSWLDVRVATGEPASSLAIANGQTANLEPTEPISLPDWIEHATDRGSVEMFLRLMFSALVDADSLDTEHHHHPNRTAARAPTADMADLWGRFEIDQGKVLAGARNDRLADVRREVYEACIKAASGPTGFYRLAVPTGGGKTRSAMAFALQHATRHDLERVIVAVPFLTVTDQTADVYRTIFDSVCTGRVVLEHHSQARDTEDDSMDPDSSWARLAAEDWSAPIVVTTTVQLFESLFSNTRSDCRKLHRLASSVIILDEAQALPSHVLHPIVDALVDLTTNYGTTVVISTATQPAFDVIPEFARIKATNIIPDSKPLFRGLSRVHYDWRIADNMSWDQVAELMRTEPQVLAVVNTKPDAHALLAALGDPRALHLSATLCGALSGIVVFGRVMVSPYLIQRCAEDGRSLVWLDGHGRFKARIQGAMRGNVLLRRAQHLALSDPDRPWQIGRQIVAAKIQNSRVALLRGARDCGVDGERVILASAAERLATVLTGLEDMKDLDRVRGAEGEAARTYFQALPLLVKRDRGAFAMERRSRRPPRDRMNALLSFLYALLRTECSAALEGVGLDPQVGFLHALRPGRPALALDLMEEFRPVLADRLALRLINLRQLGPKDFESLPGGAVHLTDVGRRQVLTAYQRRKDETVRHPALQASIPVGLVPHVQARLLARHLRGDLREYPPFVAH